MARAISITLPSGQAASFDPPDVAGETLSDLYGLTRLAELEGRPDPRDLALGDAHVLCAAMQKAAGSRPSLLVRCSNCGQEQRALLGEGFEDAVYRNDEADDPELDREFDFTRSHSLRGGVERGRDRHLRVRLAPRKLSDVLPLLEAPPPWPVTPALVARLGIVELAGRRSSKEIAARLAQASPQLWTDLGALWEQAHYPLRLTAASPCACGARREHSVPSPRLFDAVAPPGPPLEPAPEVDFPTFARWVERAQREVFEELGLRNIPVLADEGVPACDDGGNPLLGSYLPPGGEGMPPEIRLFFRSFIEERRVDRSFDIEREVFETVHHEATHHLHFLAGDDPMDDEERLVLAQEYARTLGATELRKRGLLAVVGELRDAFVKLLPLLGLLLFLFVLLYCRD